MAIHKAYQIEPFETEPGRWRADLASQPPSGLVIKVSWKYLRENFRL